MSDDKTGDGDRPRLHVVREGQTKNNPAKISPEQAKQLFMASPHLEWTTWARSMGWRTTTRPYDEFRDWQREKRDILAREQAESIAEALFSHRGRWHADVLKTLKEYPEASDAMMGIFKKRINDIIATINEDERQKTLAAQSGSKYESEFQKIDTGELARLAAGIKIATEAKHKALMLDSWNIRVAESFTDPKQFEAPNLEDQAWRVQLINGQQLDERSMQTLMKTYYDQPGGEVIDATPSDGLETT